MTSPVGNLKLSVGFFVENLQRLSVASPAIFLIHDAAEYWCAFNCD